ncbi:MAG: sugar ABC transporter substrate-binding protein [Actinomycetota bacterium]|nr:sugar ABC transporter substrate-binding protein [Actinomycetota bacterium]
MSEEASEAAPQDSSEIKIVVISGPLSDPFFSALKAGAEQAGKDLGIQVDYTAPKDLTNLGPDLTRLADAALAANPDGVVAGEYIPDVQDPGFNAITDAGIPLVLINAGPNWEELGALTYIGEDPAVFGSGAGKSMAEAGVTHGLCVNHVPGNPTLEDRCKGYQEALEAAGGTATLLTIPSDQAGNPTAVTNAIAGALRSDPSIDGVFTLGSGIAENALRAISDSGSSAKLATGDLSKNVLEAVKAGTILFAVDQQPYLQGYYGVLAAAQNAKLGLHPIGQVKTAPLMVTLDNVDKTIQLNNDNNGVRGAA